MRSGGAEDTVSNTESVNCVILRYSGETKVNWKRKKNPFSITDLQNRSTPRVKIIQNQPVLTSIDQTNLKNQIAKIAIELHNNYSQEL